MVFLKKIYNILDRIRFISIIVIFSSMILLCVIQIILRYFSFMGVRLFPWGDEIIRLSNIWVVFLAASLGVKRGAHLNVEFFLERFIPRKFIDPLRTLASIIVILVLGYLMYFGMLRTIANKNTTLQNLDFSLGLFYLSIPVGCFYLLIEYTIILLKKFKKSSKNKEIIRREV